MANSRLKIVDTAEGESRHPHVRDYSHDIDDSISKDVMMPSLLQQRDKKTRPLVPGASVVERRKS